ncbi:MAG TPA: hypothetical protein VFG14_20390 [Chthoniobacteraceae bacterium]|nr:hypothetical protein [Chthoniobacteraceae bacterium]
MSARTYICLSCRWSRRAEAAYGLNTSLRCPACNGSLWELESRWRIPRKTNDKGWKELEAKIAREAAEWLPVRQRWGAEAVARIDKQIANVEKQRASARKTTKLANLRRQRTETVNRYA